MVRKTHLIPSLLLILSLAVLAGCGNDDDPGPIGPGATAPSTDSTEQVGTDEDEGVPPGEETVFEEDFSDEDGGWDAENDDTIFTEYYEETWRLHVRKATFFAWTAIPSDEVQELADVRIEAKAWFTTLSEREDQDASPDMVGIGCRFATDGPSHYELGVDAEGMAFIGKQTDEAFETLAEQQVEDFDPMEPHDLVAVCQGERLYLQVDGETTVEATDDEYETGLNQLFLYAAGDGAEALYDDIVVSTVASDGEGDGDDDSAGGGDAPDVRDELLSITQEVASDVTVEDDPAGLQETIIAAWRDELLGDDANVTGYLVAAEPGAPSAYTINTLDDKDLPSEDNPFIFAFAVADDSGGCAGAYVNGYPAFDSFEPVDLDAAPDECTATAVLEAAL